MEFKLNKELNKIESINKKASSNIDDKKIYENLDVFIQEIMINGASERANICRKKSHDYAKDKSNFLSNFILTGNLVGISPSKAIMFFIATKVVRLSNLEQKECKPENESVKDTIDDLHNYLDLYIAAKKYEEGQTK